MDDAQRDELLIRLDEKQGAMNEAITAHIEACNSLYATKVEVRDAQIKPMKWVLTVILGAVSVDFIKDFFIKLLSNPK